MAQTALFDRVPFVDRLQIGKAGSVTEFIFFQVPINGVDPVSGTTKNFTWTNMTNAGRLGDPESLEVEKLAFGPDLGTAEADIDLVLNASTLNFWTANGQIRSFYAPTIMLLPGYGHTYSTTNASMNGTPNPLAVATFPEPIVISVNESFNVRLNFNSGPATSAASYWRCHLIGKHWLVNLLQKAPIPVVAGR